MYTIGKGSRSTFGDNYDDDFDKELFFEEEEIKEDNIREEIEQEISKIDDTTQYGNYTWNDFYSAFDEAKNNTGDYSNAIYIGWTLIAPTIKSRKLNSVRGDRYNHVQDLMQEAYLIIAKNIDNYDPTKAQFSTYIDKFLVGASREIENPDVSDYQFRKKISGFSLLMIYQIQIRKTAIKRHTLFPMNMLLWRTSLIRWTEKDPVSYSSR